MPLISIVIPCYQSEVDLDDLFKALGTMEQQLPADHHLEYVAVDDGSKDGTYSRLLEIQGTGKYHLVVMQLARNVGVHNALMAAFSWCEGDCAIVVPPDMQEPVDRIPDMIEKWRSGALVVALAREHRQDHWTDRIGAWFFHGWIRRLAMEEMPLGGIGSGLLDKRVMQEVLSMEEKNSNLIMQIMWLGHPVVIIPYTRAARTKGRSSWTLGKKIKLAIDSIVGFSYAPVRAITLIGLLFGLVALAYAGIIVLDTVVGGSEVKGWSALMVTLLMVSSFQMISLGILGEYLWRTLDATRKRPPYVIEKVSPPRSGSDQ